MRVYLITLKRSAASYHLYNRFHGFVVVAQNEVLARREVVRYMRDDRGCSGEGYRKHRLEFRRPVWSTATILGPAAQGVDPGIKLADNTGE